VTVSSAILYLAIVGIWAMVLVPRWLRPSRASGTLESNLAEPLNAGVQEDLAGEEDGEEGFTRHGDRAAAAPAGSVGRAGRAESPGRAGRAESPRRDGRTESAGWAVSARRSGAAGRVGSAEAQAGGAGQPEEDRAAGPAPGRQQADGRARPVATRRRAQTLRARRAALTTLITLTGGAVAAVAAHLAAMWVVIPPAVMLAGFVPMLRAAARTDTERARSAARGHAAATGAKVPAPAAVPAPVTVPTPAEVPDARIIDISVRVGDQLYDQYADPAVRAVGD
jgi:hypothetical protein